MTTAQHLGEVIASSTASFTAQCNDSSALDAIPTLPDPPAFGSFVRIDVVPGDSLKGQVELVGEDFDPFETLIVADSRRHIASNEPPTALFGVVVYAEIGAREPGRPLTAFGLDEDELRRSQPQIYELLAARFSAALIAYSGADGTVRPYLPPRPPRPHARVWPATVEEVRKLTVRLDYLRPLLAGAGSGGGSPVSYPPDDLVAAMLRGAYVTAHQGSDEFLLRVGRALGALLPLEYDRLRTIVERIVS